MATCGLMVPDRNTAASQEAIWPDTTLSDAARNAERHGTPRSKGRRVRASPMANHRQAISPTEVA